MKRYCARDAVTQRSGVPGLPRLRFRAFASLVSQPAVLEYNLSAR